MGGRAFFDHRSPVVKRESRIEFNCRRKRVYATYADGKAAKAEMAAKGKDVRYLYPYRCPIGDHFHLGNSDEKHQAAIDKRLERKERRERERLSRTA